VFGRETWKRENFDVVENVYPRGALGRPSGFRGMREWVTTVSPEQAGNINAGSRLNTITQRRASRDTALYPSATSLEQ
jgi:hypothetical protein